MPRAKKKPTPSELIDKLKKREVDANAELFRRLKKAQQNVAFQIERMAGKPQSATSAKARNELYAQVESVYATTNAGIDDWMLDQVEKTAVEWHSQAKKDIKAITGESKVVDFDRTLVKRYWEIIHGGNQKYLAGVFTQKMATSDLRALRSSFLDAFRQQTLEGWTASETHKALQAKWDSLAKNLRSDRFIDATGRKWENADYLNMLTRTTFQKVSRESYADSIVQDGYNLARIVDDGEPCAICRAWAGVIVDLSGNQRTHYPSLSQAYDGGWGHPRCGCRIEAMIPEVDKAEIDRQRKQPAANWKDPKSVQAYNDDIRIQAKRDEGMSQADAVRDLKRDKIKRELRFAGFEHDDIVDSFSDSMLDQMDQKAIPRIERAKKEDIPNSSRNSSLGGVIYLDKDSDGEMFKRTFNELQKKRGVSIPEPLAIDYPET